MQGGSARSIARYGALGALFLITLTPLIVLDFFFFPFITGKGFYFRVLVEIAFACWAVLALLDKQYRPRFSWIGVAVLAFVTWMLVADLFAVNVEKALWSNFERMEGWVTLIHLLLFFVVMSTVLRVEKKWRAWFYTAVGASTIVGLHGIFQLLGWAAIHQGSTRIDASLGNSAYFAIYLLFNAAIAAWLALTEKRAWLKHVLFVVAVVEAILIFFTETRGTVLGLIGGLALAALLYAITGSAKTRRWGIGALVTIIVVAGGLFLLRDTAFVHNNSVLNRITSISFTDLQVRLRIWGEAWQGFTERPILGWGQEGFNYVFNKFYNPALFDQEAWFDRAHNAFIDWLMAGGLPAFLLYLSLFVTTIIALWKSPLERAEKIAFTAALAGYAVHNLVVFDNLAAYIYFFAILAFVDSQVGRPIHFLEHKGELEGSAATPIALPIAGALLLVVLFYVNVPGMTAASELITAITPNNTSIQPNIATFKDLLTHPAFASQEIREQLVSFAGQVVGVQGIPDADKSAVATLAVTEMQKQVQAYPMDAREWLELELAYHSAGDLQDSLKAARTASALSPKKESIYIQEGAIYWDLGDTADASKAFSYAYSLGPQFTDLATYAAAGDIANGDIASGKQVLLEAFGTTTVDNDALGAAYYRVKDYPDLIALWQLRASNPNASLDTLFSLAAAYFLAGETNQAIAQVNAIVAKHPEAATEAQQFLAQLKAQQ